MSDTFNLTDNQKRLCHELTMEFIHQNNAFCMKDNDGKLIRNFDKVCDNYFDFYREFAIRINEKQTEIENPFSKCL